MNTIKNYSNNAMLSQAAYANLNTTNTLQQNIDALTDPETEGFTSSQAEEFLNIYKIIGHYDGSSTGTRVTLFEEIATGKKTTASLTKYTNRLCCFKL